MKKFTAVIIAGLIAIMVAILVTVVALPPEDGPKEAPKVTQPKEAPQVAQQPQVPQTKETPKPAQPQPSAIQIHDPARVNKAQMWLKTARFDIKNVKAEENDLVVTVSDASIKVNKPAWLNSQKNGGGYHIESPKGQIDINLTCVHDGRLNVSLLGLDRRGKGEPRIPIWIDYTKFTVNGEIVFDKPQATWHDKPYHYSKDVRDGEKLKLHVEWKQHDYTPGEYEDTLRHVLKLIK